MGVSKCIKCKARPCRCRTRPTIHVNPVINIPAASFGLLIELQVDQPRLQRIEGPGIPIPNVDLDNPLIDSLQIAMIEVNVDHISNRVWITGTVGWQSLLEEANVNLIVTRTRPGGSEEVIFRDIDEGSFEIDSVTSSFSFVDETPILITGPQPVIYRLRVSDTSDDSESEVVGPIILTGAEIRANNA